MLRANSSQGQTPGQSSSVSWAETAVNTDTLTGEQSTERSSMSGVTKKQSREDFKTTIGKIESQNSKLLHLDPPPVVRRPAKFKTDSFSLTTLPFLSWNWSERKELAHCARSVNLSYDETTTVRFFGIKFSRNIIMKTSEHGIESALKVVKLGNRQWVTDKRDHAHARMQGYKGKEAAKRSGLRGAGPQSLDEQDDRPDVESLEMGNRKAPSGAHRWLHDHRYVVVGFMGDESVPKEQLRRVMHEEFLFKEIRKAHRRIRNPFRRVMSLKTVSGFGVYECDPIKGYHREVEIDRDTERALAELWRNYCGHKLDYKGRWLTWIHENFNNSSKNPEHGRLALEFKLHWSVFKVVFWGIVPVLLSLAVGFWYMYKDHGEVDHVAATEAAWVIASYIITTSALLLALLAVITQFGSV